MIKGAKLVIEMNLLRKMEREKLKQFFLLASPLLEGRALVCELTQSAGFLRLKGENRLWDGFMGGPSLCYRLMRVKT